MIAAIRAKVPALGPDRAMAPDMARAAGMIEDGTLLAAAGLGDS